MDTPHHQDGETDANSASNHDQLILSVINHCSEQGLVIQFFREACLCHHLEELVDVFFKVMSSFGLSSTLAVDFNGEERVYRHDRSYSATDAGVLREIRSNPKIICFRQRGFFNADKTRFIVKDMPTTDPERHGRLKDHLAVILDGMNAQVGSLEQRSQRRASLHTSLIDALRSNRQMLTLLDSEFECHNRRIINSVNTILGKMYSEFCYMHLAEGEEERLIGIINEGIQPLTEVVTSKVILQRSLREAVGRLEEAFNIEL